MYRRNELVQMPKVELHLHLDGSVNPETILELALAEGVTLPDTGGHGFVDYLRVPDDCKSLSEYLAKFEYPFAVMQSYQGLERVAYELCQREAVDNIRYFEVRFAPQMHTRRGMSLDEIVQAVLDGLNEGQIEFNVKAGLILCALRHHPLELNQEIVELAGRFRDKGVVAIDLAGEEANHPAAEHAPIFQRAKELGLHITIHAGEGDGTESIVDAISQGAERIGHGVHAIDDPSILQMVKERGIMLEVCPTSNYHTKAVSSITAHPVRAFYDQGVRVSINTDNQTISHTSLIHEYEVVMDQLGFTVDELRKMNLYAAEAAFLPEKEKRELIQEILQG